MRSVLLMLCLGILLSCDFIGKKDGGESKSRVINPPSFLIEYFEYTRQIAPLTDDGCANAMERSNEATSATQNELHKCVLGSGDSLCTTENNTMQMKGKLAMILATHTYEEARFYSCVMQQDQNQHSFYLVDDDEEETSYWGGNIGAERFDDTRFIGWRERKNAAGKIERTGDEANVVDGERISLALQDDNIRTQGRIELDKNNHLRQLATHGWIDFPGGSGTDSSPAHEIAYRTYVVEFDDGNDKQQLLSLRYYGGHIYKDNAKSADKIWLALAHMRVEGATILTAVCNIDLSAGESYNKECDIAASDFKLHYIDASGNEKDLSGGDVDLSAFKQTLHDFITNTGEKWAHGTYVKGNLDPRKMFFGGQGQLAERREAMFTAGLPTAAELAQAAQPDDENEEE